MRVSLFLLPLLLLSSARLHFAPIPCAPSAAVTAVLTSVARGVLGPGTGFYLIQRPGDAARVDPSASASAPLVLCPTYSCFSSSAAGAPGDALAAEVALLGRYEVDISATAALRSALWARRLELCDAGLGVIDGSAVVRRRRSPSEQLDNEAAVNPVPLRIPPALDGPFAEPPDVIEALAACIDQQGGRLSPTAVADVQLRRQTLRAALDARVAARKTAHPARRLKTPPSLVVETRRTCKPESTPWRSDFVSSLSSLGPSPPPLAPLSRPLLTLLVADLKRLKGGAAKNVTSPLRCVRTSELVDLLAHLRRAWCDGLLDDDGEESDGDGSGGSLAALAGVSGLLLRASAAAAAVAEAQAAHDGGALLELLDFSRCPGGQAPPRALSFPAARLALLCALVPALRRGASAPCDIRADVWGPPSSPRPLSLLVPFFFHTSQAAAMGLMADARIHAFVRGMLLEGLRDDGAGWVSSTSTSTSHLLAADGTSSTQPASFSSRWHPTGWPSVGTPPAALVVTPQNMFYFASSYFGADDIEPAFKRAMHERIAWALPRLPSVSGEADARSASVAVWDAAERPAGSGSGNTSSSPLSSLAPSPSCPPGLPTILVVSSFFDAGHSSHRITKPLLAALQAPNSCLHLLRASRRDAAAPPPDLAPFRGGGVWRYEVADTDLAGAVALQRAIAAGGFDAVVFPSVGMAPTDVVLASFRSAPVQVVTYGHSASTHSPNMDLFVGGLEPEVLGPVAGDLLDVDGEGCAEVVVALQALAQAALGPWDGVEAGDGGGGGGGGGRTRLADTLGAGQPSRRPLMVFCSSTGGGSNNSAAPACVPAPAGVVRSVRATWTGEGLESVARCRTTFPPASVEPFGDALARRLQDAQARYSERLLLLPGLGLWFTGTFPAYAVALKRPTPPLSALPGLAHAARAWARLEDYGEAGFRAARARDAGDGEGDKGDEGEDESSPPSFRPPPDLVRAGTPSRPLRVALVWSLVKWNAPHLQRVLRAVRGAQARFARAWRACRSVTTTADAGRPPPPGSGSDAAAATLCAAVLAAHPTPALHVRLVAFTNMDEAEDPLQYVAVTALLRSLVERGDDAGEVDENNGGGGGGGAHTTLEVIADAETPEAFYGHLAGTDVAVDSQPFSACNTMQDLLALAIPTVSLAHDGVFERRAGPEGDAATKTNNNNNTTTTTTPLRWRSSIGACMLTKAGLTGLVALDEGEFYAKTATLLSNHALRAAWRARMDVAEEWKRVMDPARAERDARHVAAAVRAVKEEKEKDGVGGGGR
jgi:hypothetical protein